MIYNHQKKSDCHIQIRDFCFDSSTNSILPPLVNTMLSSFRGRPQKLALATARINPVTQVPLRWPQILHRTEDEFLQSFEPNIREMLIHYKSPNSAKCACLYEQTRHKALSANIIDIRKTTTTTSYQGTPCKITLRQSKKMSSPPVKECWAR
jgi:hypothetical protein